MKKIRWGQPIIFAVILAAIIVFEYGKSFNFYFVGDDFAFIEYTLKEKAAIFWKSWVYYHYCPLGLLTSTLPAHFGSFNPKWYVFINFLFFFSCSLMIMRFYKTVRDEYVGGFIAALIFATAIPNAEVIYWKTSNPTIAMTFFSILALYMFSRFLNNGSKIRFGLCFICYALSMLCLEQGILTSGILILYDVFFYSIPQFQSPETDKKKLAGGFILRHFILAIVPISLTILKLSLGLKLSAFPLASRQIGDILVLARQALAGLINFNGLFNLGHPLLTVAAGFIIFFTHFIIKRRLSDLFFLIAALSSISIIVISAGGPNSRYFCLPLMFFSCYLSSLLFDIAEVLSRVIWRMALQEKEMRDKPKDFFEILKGVLLVGISLAIILPGLHNNLIRRDYWETASRIERNMVQSVQNLHMSGELKLPPYRKVFLLNVPGYIWSDKYAIFYVASSSLLPDLRHRLGKEATNRFELIASSDFFEMTIHDEPVIYRTLGRENMKRKKEVLKLIHEGNIVLQFSPRAMTLLRVHQL